MSTLIDRVKISAAGKQQLSTLKRRTGIEHYNIICRHALCASLANRSPPPQESMQFSGGLEIDWHTFAGDSDDTLLNVIIGRALADDMEVTSQSIRHVLTLHLHRGLSYLASNSEGLMPTQYS